MMQNHETRDVAEISDAKRCLLVGDRLWVYRQPGGCFEIGQFEEGMRPEDKELANDSEQQLIHVCEVQEWVDLIRGMHALIAVANRY